MAAPTFVSAGTFVSGTGGVSPGVPASHQADDIFLMILATDGDDVTPPSGWAHVTGSPISYSSTTAELTVLWKRATSSSEATPSVADPGTEVLARTFCFRGCITSGNPWDVTATSTASTFDSTASIPGVTTTVADTLVCMFMVSWNAVGDEPTQSVSGWSNANLSSLTERGDNYADPDGDGLYRQMAMAAGTKVTAGATGTTTATFAYATDIECHLVIALKSGSTPTNAAGGNAAATAAANAGKGGVGAKAQGIG